MARTAWAGAGPGDAGTAPGAPGDGAEAAAASTAVRGFAPGADRDQHVAHLDDVFLPVMQLEDGPGERRRHFHDRLVRFDLGQGLVGPDVLALGDEPADDFALGDAFAHVGKTELSGHGQNSISRRMPRAIRSAST